MFGGYKGFQYAVLPSEEFDEETLLKRKSKKSYLKIIVVAGLIVTTGYFIAKTLALRLPFYLGKSFDLQECDRIESRLEWRELNRSQQESYINAVKCLMLKPSHIRDDISRYDDFVYAHVETGQYSHYAAAFLAWHRYYIALFEKALQDECGYTSRLPYWDWTLDSQNLTDSVIWSEHIGFGGNGQPEGDMDDRNCVMRGPFANSVRPFSAVHAGENSHHSIQDVVYQPHCLSRSFLTGASLEQMQEMIYPDALEMVLNQSDYISFFEAFEAGPHNAIPQFIRGDFYTFTAPNDPVFWLHHAQVDRVWWLWQQRDLPKRLHEFGGPQTDFRHGASGESTLNDILPMGSIARDRKVLDVANTKSKWLCYKY